MGSSSLFYPPSFLLHGWPTLIRCFDRVKPRHPSLLPSSFTLFFRGAAQFARNINFDEGREAGKNGPNGGRRRGEPMKLTTEVAATASQERERGCSKLSFPWPFNRVEERHRGLCSRHRRKSANGTSTKRCHQCCTVLILLGMPSVQNC